MLNCYKCNFTLDTGVRYDKITCIVFSDNVVKIPGYISKEFEKHSDETVTDISIKKIEPQEGLIINCK